MAGMQLPSIRPHEMLEWAARPRRAQVKCNDTSILIMFPLGVQWWCKLEHLWWCISFSLRRVSFFAWLWDSGLALLAKQNRIKSHNRWMRNCKEGNALTDANGITAPAERREEEEEKRKRREWNQSVSIDKWSFLFHQSVFAPQINARWFSSCDFSLALIFTPDQIGIVQRERERGHSFPTDFDRCCLFSDLHFLDYIQQWTLYQVFWSWPVFC